MNFNAIAMLQVEFHCAPKALGRRLDPGPGAADSLAPVAPFRRRLAQSLRTSAPS